MNLQDNNKKRTDESSVVTRFAPSPTGFLHVGSFRTALFNFLFSKQNGGKFVLRIEDTDIERSKKEYEKDILNSLKWLDFEFDEIYRQSDRKEVYKKFLEKVISSDRAYVSQEKNIKEGGRSEVIRFRNPNKKIKFNDIVRGEVEFDTTELGDFVIAKSMEEPLYHFAVVVDDYDMGITHVIRGEDHISNTPRQILIQEAIEAPRPFYAHIPLLLAPDRSKLSKRHGAASLSELKDEGYLPSALINYMALLGWNPGIDKEIFSLEELIESFDLRKVQKGGAMFSEEKLRWINKEHMKKIPEQELREEFERRVTESERFKKRSWNLGGKSFSKFFEILLSNTEVYSDLEKMIEAGEFDYIFEDPQYEPESLMWKSETDTEATVGYLRDIIDKIEGLLEEDFNPEVIKEAIWDYATEKGRGSVLWPMRYALTGKDRSPDPFSVASAIGKVETVKRLKKAIEKLK